MLYFENCSLKTTDTCYTVSKNKHEMKNEDLIYRNLVTYGNCFITMSDRSLVKKLEKRLNKELKYRPVEKGYILEVVQENGEMEK